MNLVINNYEVLLIFLCVQILGTNAEFSYLFPKIKLFFSDSKVLLSQYISKFNGTAPSLDSRYSSYSRNIKYALSAFDQLITKLYDNVNTLIDNSDDLFTNFKIYSTLWNWTKGTFNYLCSEFNETKFDYLVKHELFGQHIVYLSVSKLLKDHLNTNEPEKPLLMSFHGQTGCGKSFVSKIIVDSLFRQGFSSKYVHVYYGSIDFPHERDKEEYRKRLLHEILLSSHLCDRSVFIFDEVDKMVPGVIDVLVPYIHVENCTEINSKNIFIFLSNSGSAKIEKITYDAWLDGISRESMTLKDYHSHLKGAAYNEYGGLQHSEIVLKNIIDAFVPFLPLEKEHIKQCIVKELKLRELPLKKYIIENISNQFLYFPPEFELFSASGCKRVSNKVDLYGDNSI